MDTTPAAREEAPTGELVAGTVGDRCTNCQAPLASDQRYCVNCGERRGKTRFSFESLSANAAPAAAPAPKPKHRPRASSGATLVAGVGTLLLAMGVGVLIGHNNNSGPTRASAPGVQVVTVAGGGGGGAGAAGTGAVAAARKSSKAGKTPRIKTVKITKQVQAKASAAAGQVLGAAAPKNPTVKVGGSCTGGAGCQNGKFTGNFFH